MSVIDINHEKNEPNFEMIKVLFKVNSAVY